MVLTNTLVGQNGFLTASLIGGALYLMPMRPVLSGICLGLLSYKPQYGLLFPLVQIAASQWTVFATAAFVAVALAALSWLAFGTESWQAFLHWMLTVRPGARCKAYSRWCGISAAPSRWRGCFNGS